jgi:uncharacterized hydrophobic protein (TIGR00271 family)
MNDKVDRGFIRVSYGLRLPQAVISGLSVTLAASVFLLMGGVVESSGSYTPLIYVLMALFVLVNIASYVELTLSLPNPGGTYASVHNSEEGGWLAFIVGWTLILAGLMLAAILTKGFALHITTLLEDFTGVPFQSYPWVIGILFLLVLYNIIGSWGKRTTLIMLLLGVLLSLLLIKVPDIKLRHLTTNAIDWGTAISLSLLSFVGMEITSERFAELRHPNKNIPRAIITTVLVTGLIAALCAIIGIGTVGKTRLRISFLPLGEIGRMIAGGSGRPLILSIGGILLILALDHSLIRVVHQVQTMSRDGFWPDIFQKNQTRYQTPAILIGLIGALVFSMTFLPFHFLARLGSLLYVCALMGVNIVLARRKQNKACPFKLPFHPWIPTFILVIDGLVLLFWGVYLALGALLLTIGSLIFMIYSRHHHVEAKEGVTVFKSAVERKVTKADYVILVPIANPDTAESLLHLAGTLARQENGLVIALRVVTVPSQTPLSVGQRRAATERVLLDRALAQATKENFEIQTMTRVGRDIAQGILDTAREEDVDQILLGWRGDSPSFGASLGPIIDPIIQKSTCDVLVVKGDSWKDIKNILIPTAGGPNASTAAQLGATLSHIYDAQVTGLYVQIGRATPARMEENEKVIQNTLDGFEFSKPPQKKVMVAENVIEGILQEATGYELVLIGASEERLFDQIAFGSIPQRIAARVPSNAVMVKRYRGATEFWLRRFLRGLFNLFPTLGPQEQLEVREEMSDSAQPGVNYFVLIILSSVIATLGLLLDSPAVVIGAMLVAPLMSPVLGFSLGIILGELRLIRLSLEAVFKGVVASILVSVMVGLLSPFKGMTAEILARTQPTLLDLFIALASGMAGAYALSRKDVSAALPGVAIAAALAPPLSVVGIGIAVGRPEIAGGAFLLFITNIISINLAGVIVFTLLGIKPQNWLPETKRRIRRGVVGVILMVVIITIPLGLIMNGIIKQTRQQQIIQQTLTEHPLIKDETILDIERDTSARTLTIIATIRSAQPLDQDAVDVLKDTLEERLNQPLFLEIITLPSVKSR